MFFRRPRTLEPQEAYALWADTYPPFAHNALMEVEQDAMERMLRPLMAHRVLDVGTGSGRYLRLLARSGARMIVGLDLSAAMLERARDLSVPLVRADARRLPVAAGSFDLILASLMVGDIDDLPAWTHEMSSALRPGGSLLYSDFHPSWVEAGWRRTFETRDGRSWIVPYSPHGLDDHRRSVTRAGLEIVHMEEPMWKERPVLVVLRAVKK
ncbi:MAG TPA: class I SAM-dependent methyltransferase [Vicinamibacteria bacterium]|nr:class I SAM-dependent methyltransferase [Vicinamibacteria bacterium]